jgi:hypothetical protein
MTHSQIYATSRQQCIAYFHRALSAQYSFLRHHLQILASAILLYKTIVFPRRLLLSKHLSYMSRFDWLNDTHLSCDW